MESKTARGAIFGVVACRQGGARFAHLKAIKWSAPLLPSDCAIPYFRKSLSWTSCGAVHRIKNRISPRLLHGYEKTYPWRWWLLWAGWGGVLGYVVLSFGWGWSWLWEVLGCVGVGFGGILLVGWENMLWLGKIVAEKVCYVLIYR